MNNPSAAWRKLCAAALAYGNRLVTALTDVRSRERSARWLLLAYLAVWTLYSIIEKSSKDINFDMAEVVVWSRELSWGGTKHPPLSAWIVGLWFKVFPYEDWACYLLAIASATSALWIAWSFSKRWLDPDKRVAGLALLTLVPFFNFLAINYNANTVLVPFWALTTYCFLISYSTRSLWFAALAGAGAAACMLGKYWSIFLIAGLAIAAIIDTRRSIYFRSLAPWVTISVGLLVITPHIVWLINNKFASFDYPLGVHGDHSLWFTIGKIIVYVGSFAAYIVIPLLFVWLAARPTAGAVKDFFWPKEADARLASLAFWLPLTLPIPVILFLHADILGIWTIQAASLLPVVLLSSKKIVLTRNAIAAIVVSAIALPVAALFFSPAAAIEKHRFGHHWDQYRLIAKEVAKNWHAVTNKPLRLVGSFQYLANGTAFYLSDRPSIVDLERRYRTPWANDARIKREGIALICRRNAQECMDKVEIIARAALESRRIDFTVVRRYLGMEGTPIDYTLALIVPESLPVH
jgi:4-amino-4-deoxy-L-arabinose transferase-like glycosyltransferase